MQGLYDFVPSSYKQMEMFDTEETQARSKLMKTIDVMNNSMGQDTIRFAAQGIDHPWARNANIAHLGTLRTGTN